MAQLQDRTALITGASAGIGAATARALAAEGARVLLAARRLERIEALAEELPGAEAVVLDVRDPKRTLDALGDREFDIVVNNAGLGRGMNPIHEVSALDVDEMIDTNVKGVLNVIRAVVPSMKARGRGDLVTIGSVAGREVYPGGNVYCASKHAVRALYRALREDLFGSGLRFTTVDPGMVETEFSEVRFRGDRDRAQGVYQGMTPLRPEDVADTIRFAVTRPPHVNLGEIVLWPTDQASTTRVQRS